MKKEMKKTISGLTINGKYKIFVSTHDSRVFRYKGTLINEDRWTYSLKDIILNDVVVIKKSRVEQILPWRDD